MSYKRFNFYCGGEMYNTIRQGYHKVTFESSGTDAEIEYVIGQHNQISEILIPNSLPIEHQNIKMYNISIEGTFIHNNPTLDVHDVLSPSIFRRSIKDNKICLRPKFGSLPVSIAEDYTSITYSCTITYYTDNHGMFIPQSNTESLESLDQLANNYVKNMNTLTVAFDSNNSNNLVATFTPLTDDTLLDAVDDGKVTIRLQLMEHCPGNGAGQHGPDETYNAVMLIANTSYGNSTNAASNPKAWVRSRSHEWSYYGRTFLNLTKSQLQAGSAALTNVKYVNSWFATHGIYWNPNDPTIYSALKVEIFCAALKRKGKDPFFYERGGYRKIASNWVEYS